MYLFPQYPLTEGLGEADIWPGRQQERRSLFKKKKILSHANEKILPSGYDIGSECCPNHIGKLIYILFISYLKRKHYRWSVTMTLGVPKIYNKIKQLLTI